MVAPGTGTDLAFATGLGPSGACNAPCNGDKSENCGGPGTNNVFVIAPA